MKRLLILILLAGCHQPANVPLDYQVIGRALCRVQYDLADAYYLTQAPERAELRAAIERIWNEAERAKYLVDELKESKP